MNSTTGRVLSPRAGRTANEMADEAAAALPADASALRSAARLFDDICYGDRPGTAAGYALVQELDQRISASVPRPGAPLAGIAAGRARGSRPGRAPVAPERAERDDRAGA